MGEAYKRWVEKRKEIRETFNQKENILLVAEGNLPPQKQRRRGEFWGEAMRTSTSPGSQSYLYLPHSLQEERERAREQIMLKITEIIMRTVTPNLGSPQIITRHYASLNCRPQLLGSTLNKK